MLYYNKLASYKITDNMEKLYSGETLVGIKVSVIPDGSVPITEEGESLQLITLKHPKGTNLKPHYHRATNVMAKKVQESLWCKKGKVKLTVFGPAPLSPFVQEIVLNEGDSFIVLNGGYGITLLEDSELIEHKNGPFMNDKVFISHA